MKAPALIQYRAIRRPSAGADGRLCLGRMSRRATVLRAAVVDVRSTVLTGAALGFDLFDVPQ